MSDTLILWFYEGGYLFQHFATLFQILKMSKRENSECTSLETNILFLIGAVSRIGWTWDSTLRDFFLTYIELTLAVFTLGYAIYLHMKYKEKNYYSNVVSLPFFLQLWVLLPIVIILSFFFNPGETYFSSQIFVSLGIFCESIGLLPQLYVIKKSNEVGDISELYIVFLGIARFFRLIFWVISIKNGEQYICLLLADLIHCISLSYFIYNAIKNWSGRGLPISFNELKSKPNKKMF